MPSWVTESSDRVGPAPPPPPVNADPEYEVIDVANQQYSNSPPPIPVKSADIKRMTVMKCDLCGSVTPAVRCAQCENNLFCASCDDRYHRHPKRQSHTRTPVELPTNTTAAAPTTAVKPPLPPKGEASTSGPLPPPRRNKRPGSFLFPSPLLGRKQDQDQVRCCSISWGTIVVYCMTKNRTQQSSNECIMKLFIILSSILFAKLISTHFLSFARKTLCTQTYETLFYYLCAAHAMFIWIYLNCRWVNVI